MAYKIDKKGQIAMWVIIAVLLVASIFIFFSVSRKPFIKEQSITGPESYIEECVRQEVIKNADIMIQQGGILEPKNYKEYKKIKIEYLCDQIRDYKTCINQHPSLLYEQISILKDKVHKKVEECFLQFKKENEKRDNLIELGSQETDISLGENKVFVNINRTITISKDEDKRVFNKFSYQITHPIYDLTIVSLEIANQESQYCYFDSLGYTIFEPRFKIIKKIFSDGASIYAIEEKKSGKKMQISIRSCVIPVGINIGGENE